MRLVLCFYLAVLFSCLGSLTIDTEIGLDTIGSLKITNTQSSVYKHATGIGMSASIEVYNTYRMLNYGLGLDYMPSRSFARDWQDLYNNYFNVLNGKAIYFTAHTEYPATGEYKAQVGANLGWTMIGLTRKDPEDWYEAQYKTKGGLYWGVDVGCRRKNVLLRASYDEYRSKRVLAGHPESAYAEYVLSRKISASLGYAFDTRRLKRSSAAKAQSEISPFFRSLDTRVSFGVDMESMYFWKYSSDFSWQEPTNVGLTVYPVLEALYQYKSVSLGIGTQLRFPKSIDPVQNSDAAFRYAGRQGSFCFIPVYLSAHFAPPMYIIDELIIPDLSADFGYGLLYGDSDFRQGLRIRGGAYWGLGLGLGVGKSVCQIKYNMAYGHIQGPDQYDDSFDIRQRMLSLTLGKRFSGNPISADNLSQLADLAHNVFAKANYSYRRSKYLVLCADFAMGGEASKEVDALFENYDAQLGTLAMQFGGSLIYGYSNILQGEFRMGWRRSFVSETEWYIPLTRRSYDLLIKLAPENLTDRENDNGLFLVGGAGLCSMTDSVGDGYHGGFTQTIGLERCFTGEAGDNVYGFGSIYFLYDHTNYNSFHLNGNVYSTSTDVHAFSIGVKFGFGANLERILD
jgi:hypothetical protein